MPLQATSGAASYDAFGGGVPVVPNYIEDVFSTYLYTGTGAALTITNGIDLSTKGGLVWSKQRSLSANHALIDTVRGRNVLYSDLTDAQIASSAGRDISTFNTTGYTLGTNQQAVLNSSPETYVSWTFREQPKFFDIVTYAGNATNRTIAHNLGSVPGCIIIKRISSPAAWQVYHRSLANTQYMVLNTTAAVATGATRWNSTTPTSTVFSLGTDITVNDSSENYIAYIFAHDAGGFGLTGTDNVISCGSFTTDASGNATVNLGYEPQWVMVKKTSSGDEGASGHWWMQDNMRGYPVRSGASPYLQANSSGAEDPGSGGILTFPTSTGFQFAQNYSGFNSKNFIYIAIRRGPMKVPTTGTSVFAPLAYVGDQSTARRDLDVGFVVDAGLFLNRTRTDYSTSAFTDRLRGAKSLTTNSTSAESDLSGFLWFDDQNGIDVGQIGDLNPVVAGIGQTMVLECFKRAPSFFDEVCYTGTAAARTINHNLGVVPELMILKSRSNSGTNYRWPVYASPRGSSEAAYLDSVDEFNSAFGGPFWNSTSPTASVFSLGTNQQVNGSGATYVAYLFATCAGVSKVGSYTGTGTTKQVDCGFTGGARFVLIKRTDATGGWYVWDSARGIVSGNDSYLLLNSTAAEVTNTDYIDTYSAGFEISSTAPAAINASGGSFIFFAVA